MLKNIQLMLPLLVDFPAYILIDSQNRQRLIKQETGLSFIYFKEVSEAKDYVEKKLKQKIIVIVAPLDMAQ